MSDQIHGT
uniref:Uncharacterized protein n=1 Tax=Rhizophora mucronata TaxID=61149 RepID=A0A2P2R4C9_RHIMU